MTCVILHAPFDAGISKKSLRADLRGETPDRASQWHFYDPAIIDPYNCGLRFSPLDMKIGENIIVTNHPRRSFFAKITRLNPTRWKVE